MSLEKAAIMTERALEAERARVSDRPLQVFRRAGIDILPQ